MRTTILALVALSLGYPGGAARAYPGDDDGRTWHRKIPYQGTLERNGNAVNDSVDLVFKLYADASSGSVPLFTESIPAVPVRGGVFSVVLGDAATPIPAGLFTREALYLAVEVDGIALDRRQRILAVPFASHAAEPWAPGMVATFAGARNKVPAGWLPCDGQAVARADYPALFDAIGITYGAGNGSTTFNLPDTRGRQLVGAGAGSGLTTRNLGARFGGETRTLTVEQLPSHSHGQNVANSSGYTGPDGVTAGTGWNAGYHIGFSTANTGGGQAVDVVDPSLAFDFIIKY